MNNKTKLISCRLTEDQFGLARRKLFVESLSWQRVISALVNAYIMGDISVTPSGRYVLAPPTGYIPVVKVSEDEDAVEIEPDWGVNNPRPQMGATYEPKQGEYWGTKELAEYLRVETSRRLSVNSVRKLLRHLNIPKENNRWVFIGPEDIYIDQIKEAIQNGTYDDLIRESTKEANKMAMWRKHGVDEIREAKELSEKERRTQHLRRLRNIEDS